MTTTTSGNTTATAAGSVGNSDRSKMPAVEDLDRRAWTWYVHVRPDVAGGERGWGQKGGVELREILELRRRREEG